jgi:hypothetical protein
MNASTVKKEYLYQTGLSLSASNGEVAGTEDPELV